MNLESFFEKQRQLDQFIIEKKDLEGQDLLPNKILALQVELGELVNEWRGFKYWSNNKQPRYERKCHACKGHGKFAQVHVCGYCGGTGVEAWPLLKEYLDCLHFILSIGIDLNIPDDWVTDVDLCEPDYSDATSQFNHLFGLIGTDMDAHDWYELAEQFIALGTLLEIAWEQIEQAYLEKWEEIIRS